MGRSIRNSLTFRRLVSSDFSSNRLTVRKQGVGSSVGKHTRRALISFGAFVAAVLAASVYMVVEGYVLAPRALQKADQRPMPLKVSALTAEQQRILLTVQDPNFYTHCGVDLSPSGGVWTTITQGLVKQLYFRNFRPGFLRLGKVRQNFLAIGFNRRVPKDEQLRLFINCAYLGHPSDRAVYGFEDGAHTYFRKSFAELSRDEYLGLVATIVSPATLNPMAHRLENRDRVSRINRLLNGECSRLGKSDVFYDGCAK